MKPTTCVDCQCDITHLKGWRCEACAPVHKKRQQAKHLAASAKRKKEWEAGAADRELQRQRDLEESIRRFKAEKQQREVEKQKRLLTERSQEGRIARMTAADADLPNIKRGPRGAHSWAIIKVKELADGELFPVRWRCRDCDTIKSIEDSIHQEYIFPEGHERHFNEGLPPKGRAGHCPYGIPGQRRENPAEWRMF